MIAVNYLEDEEYGCPNCGCDRAIWDSCYIGNQPGVTCKNCGLHYQIMGKGITKSEVGFSTGRVDENGKTIMEYPVLIPHPRKGIPKWHYENPDIRPEYGDYWSPRGIGYDLSGFVKSKKAGERILDMVKDVLKTDNPKSWLDYRESEPDWIQFKFQKEEFDLEKLRQSAIDNDNVLTKEILIECKIGGVKSDK